jgi:hypothetical protein
VLELFLPGVELWIVVIVAAVGALAIGVPILRWWAGDAHRRELRGFGERQIHWERAAQKRGLELCGPHDIHIVGEIDGIPVEAGESHVTREQWFFTGVDAIVPTDLVRGVRARPRPQIGQQPPARVKGDAVLADSRALDEHLAVWADDRNVAAALLADEAVREQLTDLLGSGARVSLDDTHLTLLDRDGENWMIGDSIGLRLDQAAALAVALAEAVRRPWRELAEERGWTLVEEGTSLTLDGLDGDLRVAVRVGREEGDRRSRTVVRVDVPEPMPADLEITVRSAWNRDRGVPLADPIVAKLLCVASSEPEAAAWLVQDDEVRPSLLEVVHGHPDSTVLDERVELVVDAFATAAAADTVDLALRLARALRSRAASGFPGPPEAVQ